ncbi:MAG TPA: DUF2905 family protein [Rhizomicrobium sp.]|jgi:hypothetical protein|nr:DUF2905 family protein [Rhizomicrobium sp.]
MRWLIYLVIVLVGALVFSQAIALMELDPLPGDILYDHGNLHIHIPVLYSLATSVVVALLFWFFRR